MSVFSWLSAACAFSVSPRLCVKLPRLSPLNSPQDPFNAIFPTTDFRNLVFFLLTGRRRKPLPTKQKRDYFAQTTPTSLKKLATQGRKSVANGGILGTVRGGKAESPPICTGTFSG